MRGMLAKSESIETARRTDNDVGVRVLVGKKLVIP